MLEEELARDVVETSCELLATTSTEMYVGKGPTDYNTTLYLEDRINGK